jgi:uncharacterized phage protein (TIGR02220 family)
MALRIKSWATFQHFKDRTPPWIKLYRELLDDPDWHELDAEVSKVLVMLWLIASEDKTQQGVLPEVRKLAFRMRMKEERLNQALTKLSHWVEQDDINPISERYQSDAPETETETETETEIETEPLSGKPDVSTPQKEEKQSAREVLDFLNAKAGRRYKPLPANLRMIAARIKEGATVAECRQVIAKKCREWGTDEKMSEYLRPATLFNATKFAQYVGELGGSND